MGGTRLSTTKANDPDCGRAWLRKTFHLRSEEILSAFVELERAIHEFAVDLVS